MTGLVVAIVLLVLIAAIAFLAKFGPALRSVKARLPYKKKEYLLTKAENSFFQVLRSAVGQEYEIFAKVRLADLLYLPKGSDNAQTHRNKIFQKHVDFVLCDPVKVSPLLAIELDDSSHQKASRQERDSFVDEAFRAAELPLLRIVASRAYSPKELSGRVREYMSGQEATSPDRSQPAASSPSAPGRLAAALGLCPHWRRLVYESQS